MNCVHVCKLTTDEAGIFQYFFLLLLFTPEIGERVDDDTEDEIQNYNDDDEEEQKVVDDTSKEQRFLLTGSMRTQLLLRRVNAAQYRDKYSMKLCNVLQI